jgi:multiple sugar transport system substrate-binding protein
MKTQPKINYLILATLVITSMLLSSCGQPAAPTSEAPAAAVTNPDEVTTITAWAFEGEEGTFDNLVKGFMAENPNVKVEITDFPEEEYTTKIDTALIAGEPPDLGFIYEPKWIKAGEFLPMNDMIAEQGIPLTDLNQGAMGVNCIIDG